MGKRKKVTGKIESKLVERESEEMKRRKRCNP